MTINNRGDAEKLPIRPGPGAIIVVIAVLFLGAAIAYLVVPIEPAAAWAGVLGTLGL